MFIACTYADSPPEEEMLLKNSWKDPRRLKALLIGSLSIVLPNTQFWNLTQNLDRFCWKEADIIVLSDGDPDSSLLPTRENIVRCEICSQTPFS